MADKLTEEQLARKWDWRKINTAKPPRKVIQVSPGLKVNHGLVCCCCSTEVNPGLCYRGKVIRGFSDIKRQKVKTEHVTYQPVVTEFRIPTIDYVKGYLCDTCAADYSVVYRHNRDGSVESFPVVVTDPLPVLTVRDQREGSKSYKGFNTRITQ